MQPLDRQIRVGHHHGFGDLEHEGEWREPARLERVSNVIDDRLRLELLDREVDAHRQRRLPREPPVQERALTAGFLKDPTADWDDQASLFGEWDEVERRDRPARWVHPTKQRFDTVVGAVIEANDGLVMDHELLQLERPLQLRLKLEALDHSLVHRRLEDAVAAF